ncbi:MAG: hypothetical protein IKF96_06440, partial [Eggerthellaceae bacterium]|nr:hypothetical protein [Eggerthellaceae bacterium]
PAVVPDETTGVYTYRTDDAAGPDDPTAIADIIETLKKSGASICSNRRTDELYPLEYGDFMVITAKKDDLDPIRNELVSRGIPTWVEGSVPFPDNEALVEIARIYGAVAAPSDEFALAKALTGKLIGLSPENLARFVGLGRDKLRFSRDDAIDISRYASDASAGAVAGQLNRLSIIAKKNLSPVALFAAILDEYRVFEILPANDLEITLYALELMRSGEQAGGVSSLEEGATFLADTISNASTEVNERYLNFYDTSKCVHLANLHKVKGLEAPVVILAGAKDWDTVKEQYRIEHGIDGTKGYFFRLKRDRAADGSYRAPFLQTSTFDREEALEKDAGAAERLRHLYVGATRAGSILVLNNNSGSKWARLAENGTPDFFETFGKPPAPAPETPIMVAAADLYDRAEAESKASDTLVRASSAATFKAENPSKARSKLEEASDESGSSAPETVIPEDDVVADAGAESSEPSPERPKRFFAALSGTMVHRLMEMLVASGNRLEVDAAIPAIVSEIIKPEAEGMRSEFEAQLGRVAATMRNGGYPQDNAAPQDILATLLAAESVLCEVPFCYL